ncbi:Uncharacterised protein [Vibrio cholerae]|nr:Uncharacterised protein [Vibrio cholerae]
MASLSFIFITIPFSLIYFYCKAVFLYISLESAHWLLYFSSKGYLDRFLKANEKADFHS